MSVLPEAVPFNWVDLRANTTAALVNVCRILSIPVDNPIVKRSLIAKLRDHLAKSPAPRVIPNSVDPRIPPHKISLRVASAAPAEPPHQNQSGAIPSFFSPQQPSQFEAVAARLPPMKAPEPLPIYQAAPKPQKTNGTLRIEVIKKPVDVPPRVEPPPSPPDPVEPEPEPEPEPETKPYLEPEPEPEPQPEPEPEPVESVKEEFVEESEREVAVEPANEVVREEESESEEEAAPAPALAPKQEEVEVEEVVRVPLSQRAREMWSEKKAKVMEMVREKWGQIEFPSCKVLSLNVGKRSKQKFYYRVAFVVMHVILFLLFGIATRMTFQIPEDA